MLRYEFLASFETTRQKLIGAPSGIVNVARLKMTGNTKTVGSPLYVLLNQINAAAASGLHLVAVGMAVALPDICVSLSSLDGRSNGQKYRDWCAANLLEGDFSYVTGEDLWSMRCGVLHHGRYGDLKHNVARVIFAVPTPENNIFVDNVVNDAYFYSVVDFCKNLCDAAYRWHESNKHDQIVIENSAKMMQYYPNGLPPYVVGMPVIA